MHKLIIFLTLLIVILLTIFNPNVLVSLMYLLVNEKIIYTEFIISSIYFVIFYQKTVLGLTPANIKKNFLLHYKKIKNNEINYYRELPQKGNLNQIFWLASSYKMINNRANLIGAFILKWLKEEKIQVNNKNEIILPESCTSISTDTEESVLINLLYEIAGENNILEIRELKRWMKKSKNKKRIDKYFNDIIMFYNKAAIDNGLIISENGKIYETPELRAKALQIEGFRKFILDESFINKRELQEVKIWEDYLIIAHLLGVAKQVRKNLKQIYPDIESFIETNYNSIFEYLSFEAIVLWEIFLFLPLSVMGGIMMGTMLVGAINFALIIVSIPARFITRRFIKRKILYMIIKTEGKTEI